MEKTFRARGGGKAKSFDERVRKIIGIDQRRLQVRKGRSEVPDGISHFDSLRGSIGAKEVFVEVEATGEPLAVFHERIKPEPAVDVVNSSWRDFIQQDIEGPAWIGSRLEDVRQINVGRELRIPVRPVPVRRVGADDQRPLLVADRSGQNARHQIGATDLAVGNQNDGLTRPFGQEPPGELDGLIVHIVPRRAKRGRIGDQAADLRVDRRGLGNQFQHER